MTVLHCIETLQVHESSLPAWQQNQNRISWRPVQRIKGDCALKRLDGQCFSNGYMRTRKQLDDTIDIVDQGRVTRFVRSNVALTAEGDTRNICLPPMPREILQRADVDREVPAHVFPTQDFVKNHHHLESPIWERNRDSPAGYRCMHSNLYRRLPKRWTVCAFVRNESGSWPMSVNSRLLWIRGNGNGGGALVRRDRTAIQLEMEWEQTEKGKYVVFSEIKAQP